jgi:hypothetical protein
MRGGDYSNKTGQNRTGHDEEGWPFANFKTDAVLYE